MAIPIDFLRTMRLKQWVKNVFIFAPMVFALHLFQIPYIARSVAAFLLFGLAASGVYVINDVVDRERDRQHPRKKHRPIAAGRLGVRAALVGAALLVLVSLAGSYRLDQTFFVIVAVYLTQNLLYSFWLKNVVIVDIMLIAIGFDLRVIAGGAACRIELSPWILIIIFLLAIFLALVKRRQELLRLERGDVEGTRHTLRYYTRPMIDQMIGIATATTLISYVMYVLSPETVAKFKTHDLIYTVPFVIYGIFRYLFLSHAKGEGENPAEVIYTDLPFTLNLIAWVAVFIWIVLR